MSPNVVVLKALKEILEGLHKASLLIPFEPNVELIKEIDDWTEKMELAYKDLKKGE